MLNVVISENSLYWTYENMRMSKLFEQPIRQSLELSDKTGMVVVLEAPHKWKQNKAFIIEVTGEIRKEIIIPQEVGYYCAIYDVYYEGDTLAFILTTNGFYDLACLFDEHGNFLRSHLTK